MTDTLLDAPPMRLVPGSGIQFIDFELKTEQLSITYGRFVEEIDTSGHTVLIPLSREPDYEGVEWHPATNRALRPEETLWLNGYAAVEPFLGIWLPLPYLRALGPAPGGAPRFDLGPTNWARLYLEPPASDLRQSNRVKGVVAFDTRVLSVSRLDQQTYLAPNEDDVRHGSEFRLACAPAALADLVAEAWVEAWLATTASPPGDAGGKGALPGGAATGGRFVLERLARYLTLLSVLGRIAGLPPVRFVDAMPAARRAAAAPGADLVVDIGDDQTAALIVPRQGVAGHDALPRAFPLRLRELTRPTVTHAGPFPTRGEFDRPQLGSPAASRLSGRTDAFYWPSLMRIGHEAQRLSLKASAVPGITGLGELRSRLGETAARTGLWRFSREDRAASEPGGIVAGEILAHVSEDGSIIGAAGGAAPPALRPRFSASALLAMYAAELVLQALTEVGAMARQGSAARALLLNRIVVTCPLDAGAEEQALLRQRIESGVDLVWSAYGWSSAGSATTPPKPQVVLGLDSGLAAHLVYLHDEVAGRHGGNWRHFFDRISGRQPSRDGSARLTIASLDMSGSATGLAIVGYELGRQGAPEAHILLADRSSISAMALQDKLLVELVLPAIARHLSACGHPRPWDLIQTLVQGGGERQAADPHLQVRFAHKVLKPATRALFQIGRDLAPGALGRGLRRLSLAELVRRGDGELPGVAAAVDRLAHDDDALDFRLADVQVPIRHRAVAQIAARHFQPLLQRVAQLLREHACDLVILTGAYAGVGQAKSLLLAELPVAPHRIIDLGTRDRGIVERLVGHAGVDEADARQRLLPLLGAALAQNDTIGAIGLGDLVLAAPVRRGTVLPGTLAWPGGAAAAGTEKLLGAPDSRHGQGPAVAALPGGP